MANNRRFRKGNTGGNFLPFLFCGLILGLAVSTASAEEPTIDDMVCALNPKCTRPFVDRRLRGITAKPSEGPPGSFDRTINFEFDSAELTADARRVLDDVAQALSLSAGPTPREDT